MYKKVKIIVAVALCIAIGVSAVFAFSIRKTIKNESVEVGIGTQNDERYCLLIIGKDRVSGLADVIMLASLDTSESRISVMQLPRDTYAEYGNKNHRKLNAALASLGGEEKLKEYLASVLGIEIDGYISLDLDGFANIVDAVGGVEIEIEKPLRYDDPEQDLHIALDSGRQLLDGKTAEMFVRYRSGYSDGDIGRLDAQKKFLAALFHTLKNNVDIKNIDDLARAVVGSVKTDVPLTRAITLALKALALDTDALGFYTMPGEAITSKKTGASFYVMSAEPTENMLCEYFGRDERKIDPERLFAHPEYEDFIKIYESTQ